MRQAKGYYCAIAAAVAFGLQPLIATYAYSYGIGSNLLAFLKVLIMVPVFAIACICKKESLRLSKKQAADICVLAFTGAALTSSLLFASYRPIDTGMATSLNFTHPVFVLVLGALFYRDRFSKATWISLFICVCGVSLFCDLSSEFSWKGFGWALLSGLTYGIYVLYMEKSRIMESISFLAYTFYFFLFASCMLFFITLFAGELNFSFPGEAWKIIVLFSLDGRLLATVLLQCSVSFIGSAKSAILGALEPVTSMAVGIAILGEHIKIKSLIGCILIVISTMILIIYTPKESSKPNAPASSAFSTK